LTATTGSPHLLRSGRVTAQVVISSRVDKPRNWARTRSGAVTISALI